MVAGVIPMLFSLHIAIEFIPYLNEFVKTL